MTMYEIKRAAIFAALKKYNGDKYQVTRELRICIKSIYNLLTKEELKSYNFSEDLLKNFKEVDIKSEDLGNLQSLDDILKSVLSHRLLLFGNNRVQAAKSLGINRNTLSKYVGSKKR